MKANKRVRDLKRRSTRRFYIEYEGRRIFVTTFPVDSGKKANDVQEEARTIKGSK
jgi:hypothetical protein